MKTATIIILAIVAFVILDITADCIFIRIRYGKGSLKHFLSRLRRRPATQECDEPEDYDYDE